VKPDAVRAVAAVTTQNGYELRDTAFTIVNSMSKRQYLQYKY